MIATPIADYALLSDRRTAALVSRTARWTGCARRFDSPTFPAGFRPAAGTGRCAPSTRTPRRPAATSTRRCCRTTTTATAPRPSLTRCHGRRGRPARSAPLRSSLVRAECTGGEVEMAVELAPRPGWSRRSRRWRAAWDVYGELLSAHRPSPSSTRPPGCYRLAGGPRRVRRRGLRAGGGEGPGPGSAASRHFLYSKLMCWVALDRAVAFADTLRATDCLVGLAAEVCAAILTRGGTTRRSRSPGHSAPLTPTRPTG
jgi:hypothetical protein